MKPLNRAMLTVVSAFLAVFAAAGVGFAQPAADSAPPGISVAAQRSHSVFNREEADRLRRETHSRLVSEQVRLAREEPITVRFSNEEKAQVDLAESGQSPVKVGLTRDLNRRIRFDDLKASGLPRSAQRRDAGALQATPDGGYVYTLVLDSPGAAGIRLHFTDFWLPSDAELFLYTEDGQVYGPYVGEGPLGDGDFWSNTVMGEEIFLQLRQYGPVSDEDLADTSFVISGLGHVRPKFISESGFCDYNASCVVNAECPGADSAVNVARDAVAEMQWISGPYLYMCTGSLIADSDDSSEIPYFLSANHCISRGKDARSLENFFQFTEPCGTINCPDVFDTRANYPEGLRTLGATIKATSRTGDFTLFQLADPAPDGSAFLGWTTQPVAYADGQSLYRISHPQGGPQAYSEHAVDTSATTCNGWPRGSWIYSRDIEGATEGGSSGSPVVNVAGEVVGQLSGACGYNVNDVCDANSNATVDGAFASYYSLVAPFLGSSSSCVSSPEVCNDGIDNDCDGFIDCNDSNCSGDPDCSNVCDPRGVSCTADDQCCSGKCHPRKRTCN